MKYFIVTMEERCLNKAAEKLFITRSPLGKVIGELEDLIGSKLFDRFYNELVPTNVAIDFYNKIKPLYDSLSSLEENFLSRGRIRLFEIIFDVSVPYNFYKYMVHSLQAEKVNFTHIRKLVTQDTLLKLNINSHAVILSMRDINAVGDITKHTLKEDSLELIMSSSITEDNLNDAEFMKHLPLFVRPSDYVSEIKIRISNALQNTLPYIFYEEVDADITTMFYSVVNKKGMILLPRKLAELHSSQAIFRKKIKGVTYKNILLHNVQLKNHADIDKIKQILKNSL